MLRIPDKRNRNIDYEVCGDSAYAYHENKRIGFVETSGLLEVDHHGPLPAVITGWEVEHAYRRAGIATQMIKLLVEELGVLDPGQGNIGIGGQNALTDEGEYTVEHCQKLGLVHLFPDEVDDYDDE